MIENNDHIDDHDNVQNLIALMENSPENYQHLQIFLSRDGRSNCSKDNEFLMVSPNAFGKIKLLDLSVEDQIVILEIKDCSTNQVGNVRIDIGDASPRTFFICWQDIKRMVMSENKSMLCKAGLLDFDFENNSGVNNSKALI